MKSTDQKNEHISKASSHQMGHGNGISFPAKSGNTSGALQAKGGLPDALQSQMESSMNADFSNVSVKTDSSAAKDVGALAFAQGNEVHFAPGQFKPETQSGQELIGHELAHVVQQREGRVQATGEINGTPVNADSSLEKEADDMGKKAASAN